MNEIVKVKEKEVVVLEWKGQRVVTTAQLAEIYEANEQQIQQNFNNNQKNFEEVLHYFLLKGEELKEFKGYFDNIEEAIGVSKFAPQLYLWTRRGASRHCKILDTEKAWEQFDALEENYYNPKKLSSENAIDQILENPDFGIKLLTAYKEEKEKTRALQIEVKEKEKQIDQMQLKTNYYDLILHCKDLIATTIIAKDYGMTAQAFNKLLHNLKIQYKQDGVWVLYRNYQDQGYTGTKTYNYSDREAIQHAQPHTYWTQKGRVFLYRILKENGYLPVIEQSVAI